MKIHTIWRIWLFQWFFRFVTTLTNNYLRSMVFLHNNLQIFSTVVLKLSLTELKFSTDQKTENIKLSQPLSEDGNDSMTALIASLSGFRNIPKPVSNGILSKSRLTNWKFVNKSSWRKDFKISLWFDINLVK